MSKKQSSSSICLNKKARHYYELLSFVEAGIVLVGGEMKSIRAGAVNFHDAYVSIKRGEAFLLGLHIAPYVNAGYIKHDPDRERKLLLHKKEIEHLSRQIEQKGLTIVPVNMHFSRGKVKVEIAVAKGKKLHDQRQDLKAAAVLRDVQRDLRNI